MKKKLLLLVLSASLLGGCDFNIESLKFWKPKETENSQENQGKIDENGQNQNDDQHEEEQHEEEHHEEQGGGGEEHQEEQGGGGEQEQHEELLQEYTATIETHGSYFNTNFKEGTNFTITSPQKTEELRQYLEEPLEYENLFTSLQCDYCTTRKVDGDTYLQIGTGSYAKGEFNYGTLIFGSEVKIYDVKITAFNYSKPYSDHSTGELIPNVDTECHLKLDSVDLNMELPSTSAPVEKTVEKHYENGTNSFTLVAMSGRVLIKEMTITWRG